MTISTESSPPSHQHSLAELAQSVASSAAIVQKELDKMKLPPVDDETFPVSFPLLSAEGCRARLDLLSAALNLVRLASGPAEGLANLTLQGFELGTIAAIIRLHTLDYIPLGGSSPFQELSEKTGVSHQLLVRLIRYSISAGFLSEPSPGVVAHNSASSACLRDPNIRDSILWNVNVATPAAIKLFESLQLDPTGKDETKTGVSVAMAEPGKPLPTLWDYHATHPNEERQFDNAMASTQSISVYECKHVARGFDWNKVQTIVDMGGSEGHVSTSIYDSYPHVKSTVQDVGQVITRSREQLPAKYAGSIRFEEHDFFQPQKQVADCYILRFVLHNWSDAKAQDIIRNLSPALRPGARVLVIEHVLPTGVDMPLYIEKIIRNVDVSMFGLLAGRERTEDDFKRLLGEVDPHLQLQSSHCPDGSAMTIMEFQVSE